MKRTYSTANIPQGTMVTRTAKRYRRADGTAVALTPAVRVAVDREIRRMKRLDTDKRATMVTVSNNAVPATGDVRSVLSSMALGDASEDKFQGEAITPIGLTVRFKIDCTAADNYNAVRLLLVQWNGSGPASTGGAARYLNSVGSIMTPFQGKEWGNRKNFRVLADTGPIVMQSSAIGAGGNGELYVGQIYVNGKKFRKVSFDEDGTVVRGDIAVVIVTDSTTSSHPIVDWASQLSYIDV